MGLDMFLEKHVKPTKATTDDEIIQAISNSKIKGEEIGYWRKANQIHNWFVENVQNGVDNCEYFIVKKEQLEKLLNLCIQVKASCHLIKGSVVNGYRYDNGKQIPIIESGEVIEDSSVANALLPTASGFFFGSTEYNEYYYQDIESTIEILTDALESVDFEKEVVTYLASW